MKVFRVILFVLLAWVGTFGAMNASWQCEPIFKYRSTHERRYDAGVNALFSLTPPIWFASVFLTGFYQDGWQLNIDRCNADAK